jgi:ribose transport system permease protein
MTLAKPTPSPPEPAARKVRHPSEVANLLDPSFWADWASAVGLVGLVVIFGVLQPVFLSVANIQALLLASAILIILSVGQTFVVATAGIDLSLGATVMLGAVTLGLADAHGWGILPACILALLVTSAVGFLNGLVITIGKIPDFVVTLGSLSAVTGIGLVLSGGEPTMVGNAFLLKLASSGVGPLGYPVLVAVAVGIFAHVALFYTRFGVHLLATGGQQESARSLGIHTGSIRIAAYAICGVCAGIASILLVARIGSAEPTINTSLLLNSVAAVVLGGVSLFGGRGSILGPVLGALMLTTLVNGLTLLSVSAFYQPLAVGFIVVLAALIMRYQR